MKIRFVLCPLLLAAVAACGSSSSPSTPSPSGGSTGTPVSIVRGAQSLTTTAYAPNPLSVSVGSSVTWTNNDSTSHTSSSDNGAWNSGSIPPGGTFTTTFSSPGTFKYHCAIHPNMVGTVTVQ